MRREEEVRAALATCRMVAAQAIADGMPDVGRRVAGLCGVLLWVLREEPQAGTTFADFLAVVRTRAVDPLAN